MILCESVRLGAAIELDPRATPVRTMPGRVLVDETSGLLHVHDGKNYLIVWPPPGTVAVLPSPGEEKAAEFSARVDAEKTRQANEPTRSATSDSPPPARPVKPRR